MTLRTKLLASPAPLAVVLVLLGVASVKTLRALGESPELLLKDNYRSVLALEQMGDALDRLQQRALEAAAGRVPGGDAATPAELRARFEAGLALQEGNITEAGEEVATRDVRRAWEGYLAALEAHARRPAAERLDGWFRELAPRAAAVRRASLEILDLNQDAMGSKSARARRAASRSVGLVVVATLAALGLGLVTSLALTARLLRPLGVLSGTVRRIAGGDLEARARVEGTDEIAALAREFNAMADRLSEYRRSSLGELLQAQQASQAAIDSLPDPVVVLDAGGAVLHLNGAAEGLLRPRGGASPDAAGPALSALLDRIRRHVLGGHGPYAPRGFDEAVQVSTAEGPRRLLPRGSPLYAEAGAVAGVTVVLQDVTRLVRFDELRNDLVATVAHEFRTPLTSLRMAIHLCAEGVVGPLTEKQADLIGAARDECERLQGIVDDLLNLSRLQAGRMELATEQVPAEALLREATVVQRAAAEDAGVALAVEPVAEGEGARADRERVGLVLSNLLANALRHTPRGGRITLRAADAGAAVRFEVADTGEGIPAEFQERIFEKFFRVPGARAGGVGLGLYLAREIVLAHGGEMGVESAPGRGSTFWFTLPRVVGPARA